jgi:glucose-1-phosphatase
MIKYILFDLGGVIINLTVFDRLSEITGIEDRQEVINYWTSLKSVADYETGKISDADFLRQLKKDLGYSRSECELHEEFRLWCHSVNIQAHNFTIEMISQYRIGIFSNTNPIHHKRLNEIWNTENLQIDEFMSYQIGLMKPNDEAFEYVVRKLGVAKNEILFIDDSQKNVESAVRNGLNAYLFKNNEDLEIIKNLLYQEKKLVETNTTFYC